MFYWNCRLEWIRLDKKKLFLLGSYTEVLTGGKLPSLRQVLGYFLHEHSVNKKTVRDASAITMEMTLKFWHKARIPVREPQHCQSKLEREFEEWRLLKKNAARTSATQKAKEAVFSSKLDDLFDVAHANALDMITIDEDRAFLLAQREKGRRGYMAGLDASSAKKEKKSLQAREKLVDRRRRAECTQRKMTEKVLLVSSTSSSSASEDSDYEAQEGPVDAGLSTPSCPKRGRRVVMNPRMTSLLDRTKVSDRKAVLIIAETAKSLGHPVQDLVLNRSSIQRLRQHHRAMISARLKDEFQADAALVVHWDGKLLRDLTGTEKFDRLPILVSGRGVSQLLMAAKLPSSTGQAVAEAVCAALNEWGIAEKVRAMSFDTTSLNTGQNNGACVLLEEMLGHKLLSFACRHHVFELVIGAVFQLCMGTSSAPEVLMFKRFQSHWQFVDQTKFETGINDEEIAGNVADVKETLLEFAMHQLQEKQPRDDYREFLELSVIFLGGVPTRGIRFLAPGPMHHARWMSKVIYSLKIWLFKSQFDLSQKYVNGLRNICVFAIRLYVRAWTNAPLAAAAPQNDLRLLQALVQYETLHPGIAKVASAKMAKHLWYLSEDLVALALFDKDVSADTKRELIRAIKVIH